MADHKDDTGFQAAMGRLGAIAGRAAVERIEAQIPHLVEVVGAAGAAAIVLKGPVTRQRLYPPGEPRPTADVDLLVAPRAFRRAARALAQDGLDRVAVAGHSDTFLGPAGEVDLHLALPYTTAPPRRSFAVLSSHVTWLTVAGCGVPVLDEPAHVVHLAVHAAQNDFDPAHRSFDEWQRGFEGLSAEAASTASAIATEIGAGAAWTLARRALAEPTAGPDLASLLPRRQPGASPPTLWSFVRSPIPVRVRWRAARTPVRDQVSDHVVNAWRVKRGLAPLAPDTMAIRWAKATRLVTATAITVSRPLTDGRSARRPKPGAPPRT